jgi:hypothetical protein
MIIEALLFTTLVVKTHDWYDQDCCSDRDCHPVPDGVVIDTPDGVKVYGRWTIPYGDKSLRWSRDDHDHICTNNLLLFCVYRKPNWM